MPPAAPGVTQWGYPEGSQGKSLFSIRSCSNSQQGDIFGQSWWILSQILKKCTLSYPQLPLGWPRGGTLWAVRLNPYFASDLAQICNIGVSFDLNQDLPPSQRALRLHFSKIWFHRLLKTFGNVKHLEKILLNWHQVLDVFGGQEK